MTKSGKASGSNLLRWIFGIVFILIIISAINAGIRGDHIAEEASQAAQQSVRQTGDADLTEAGAQAEEAEWVEAGQYRGLEGTGTSDSSPDNIDNENNMDNNPDNSLEYSSPANGKIQADKNLTVHFLDVGQGDSILLEYDGSAILVDAGERNQGSGVSAYLYEQDISGIDYVVATHPHFDHIGGMEEVLNSFKVGFFIDSGFPHTTKTYENMLTTIDEKNIPFKVAKRGEKIEFSPSVDVEVLNPGTEYSDDLNENSIVLKVSYGEISFLLMGDAGLETEGKLMNAGYNLDSNIIKVGHHASRSGSGEKFISAVSPEISIIEVGENNDYGHPHKEVLERLQRVSMVYRTDLDGSIVITTDGSAYTIITQNTSPERKVAGNETTVTRADSPSGSMAARESGSEEINPGGTEPKSVRTEPEPEAKEISSEISSSKETPVYVSDLSLRDEWVEITNRGSSAVSLKGWKIEDDGSKHTYTFSSYALNSQSSVTLYTGKGMDTATEIYWGSGSPIWNNDGDTAYLYDSSGNLVSKLER